MKKTTVWIDIYRIGIEEELTVLYTVNGSHIDIKEVIIPETQEFLNPPRDVLNEIQANLEVSEFDSLDLNEDYE